MRRYALIAGLVILTAGFAGAWFVLQPRDSNYTNTSVQDTSGSALDDPQPLVSDVILDETAAPDRDAPLTPGADTPDRTGNTPTRTPSDPPAEVKVQPNPPDPAIVPGEAANTHEGEPNIEGQTPAVPVPKPEKFIKGYPRPVGQNLGNTRPGARKISKPAGIRELSEVTPKLMQDRRGLYAQYLQMDSADVSKLDTSKPDMVRIDQSINFPNAESFADLPISLENFAAAWTGFLVIDEPGDYWLFWGADNGGRVELDGETVLLQDGMVRYVEVSTVLTLEAGLHPLKIEFAQTQNNVADWAKCAANFMYVPEGQTKPIPVPPEMLMVPEWMWSDNAPIITSLSKTEGEIGDEITIMGQGFGPEHDESLDAAAVSTRVTFAGQFAEVSSRSETRLRVKVPIGAKTGKVIVYRSAITAGNGSGPVLYSREIPSNSIDFTVTTQFGIMAEWHNLEGWTNFGTEAIGQRKPDLVRLEKELYVGDVEMIGGAAVEIPFESDAVGARFEFRLGVPRHAGKDEHEYTMSSTSSFTLSVGGQEVQLTSASPRDEMYFADFALACAEEHQVPVVVEWVGYSKSKRMLVLTVELRASAEDDDIARTDVLPLQYYLPPVVPPKPPEISNVKAVRAEGEQPVAPPYDVDASRPSVNVGQEFTFDVVDFGPSEIWDTLPTITIDGVPLTYTIEDNMQDEPDGEQTGDVYRTLKCRAIMPDGVGEGRMLARLSIVNSEPFYIDIANRGLVAYLYDVPDGSGVSELPDLGPLACFKVRKDRSINFEDTADFDLPFPAETFVIEWLGGLIIEEEGDYEFICRSDDGMKLWLDDNVVIDANHRQAPAENKATAHLVPGVYRFRMQFFENNQHEVCVLEWRATQGEGEQQAEIIPREVIPARAFSLDTHPPFPDKTSTGKRTDGS